MLSSARISKIEKLLNALEIESKDYRLFDEALTHPSYNTEHNVEDGYDYERLEFLGDSVLRVIAALYLYEKYPYYDEGRLTKIRSCIVSDKFLAVIASKLEYYKYINLGIGEERDKGRTKESILACTFEAVLGAIYLSVGHDIAKSLMYRLFDNENIEETVHYYNSKEVLQEYTQGINKDLPEYRIINETGPAHNKLFEVGVFYHNEELGRGKGKTKKEAEQHAARNAIEFLDIDI